MSPKKGKSSVSDSESMDDTTEKTLNEMNEMLKGENKGEKKRAKKSLTKNITEKAKLPKREKKPIPNSLQNNDGIRFFFYFIYVFAFLGLLNAVNTNLFTLNYYLELGPLFTSGAPLIPPDIFTVLPLNLFSFFMAILGLTLRIVFSTGLAVIAFDDTKDSWLRIVSVIGISFIIFGIQLIGP